MRKEGRFTTFCKTLEKKEAMASFFVLKNYRKETI